MLSSCVSNKSGAPRLRPPETLAQEGTAFTGTVVYNELEGGFYGVVTDTGENLRGDLPAALQKDGLLVTGRYVALEERAGIQMWGKEVKFVSIDRRVQVLPGTPQAMVRSDGRVVIRGPQ